MAGIFICYERVTESEGRILSTASVVDDYAHANMLEESGTLFVYIPLDSNTGYLSLGDDGNVIPAIRPALDLKYEPQVSAGTPTTIKGIPAAVVSITGPGHQQQVEHAGGDLVLSFVLPGQYSIWGDPFPNRSFMLQITVS